MLVIDRKNPCQTGDQREVSQGQRVRGLQLDSAGHHSVHYVPLWILAQMSVRLPRALGHGSPGLGYTLQLSNFQVFISKPSNEL